MKRNILILEDLKPIRELLTNIVSSLSDEICVYSFDNYIEAFRFSMSKHIDLFLLDIVLEPKEEQDFSGITFSEEHAVKTKQSKPITNIFFIANPFSFFAI